ncbi:hypothetical protein D2E23_1322 [Bifidobacterium callimiconis]|uniref:Phosphatidylglycerol lysyltransferase C-terminal domain-containing protein n=2 Tax=Bifidobacterium callimiconis TaxID=2306973 RepID=A0A430FCU2_9BIFI|nr:phosphatidylglycerol lysyltransferase domain-containing protein [Bifidobacterium callimiconis]RSX50657.1 hypothetical protein D2E23_1322 [Bifidobacterium callimiconis]
MTDTTADNVKPGEPVGSGNPVSPDEPVTTNEHAQANGQQDRKPTRNEQPRNKKAKGSSEHGRFRSFGPVMRDVTGWVRSHPLTVSFAVVVLAINLAFVVWAAVTDGVFPPQPARISYDKLVQGMLYVVPLALLLVMHPLRLLLDIPVLLVAGSVAESRFGAAKTAWVALICSIGGIAAGMGVSVAVNGHSVAWSSMARLGTVLGPLAVAVGPLMAASAFTSLLWRHRIRVIGYAIVATLVLYRGEPGDYCILAAALFGHLLGYLMAQRDEEHMQWNHGSVFETRRMLGIVSAVFALGPLVAMSSPIHHGPLSTLGLLLGPNSLDNTRLQQCLNGANSMDCFVQYRLQRLSMPGGIIVSLLPCAFMLAVSWGLFKGRRLAAWTSIIANIGTAALAVVYYLVFPLSQSPDGMRALIAHGAWRSALFTALLPIAFALVVAMSMRCFRLKTSGRRLATALTGSLGALIALCAAYLIIGLTRPNEFTIRPGMGLLIEEMPRRFLPIGFLNEVTPDFLPRPHTIASAVYQGIGPVFWIVAILAALWCFTDAALEGHEAQAKASKLVEIDGESMSFMGTWDGNRYWFSPSGNSVIAYRVEHGIALTVTGPFGDKTEWEQDFRDFIAYCTEQSWTPVFYSVHAEQRELLASMGWQSLDVGTEMVVLPAQWQTRGKKWQDVRTAINKAKRDGVTDVLTTFEQAPLSVQSQIMDISEQWAEEKSLPEMKFTLGGVEELLDPRVRLLCAVDADGTVQAVTSWLPTWRDGQIVGWTLDFMRHRPDSANGVMEFLIARMAERLKDEGAEFMSLSAAPLAGISVMELENQSAGVEFLQHVLMAVADIIEPVYGFHSLFRFKKKFQPQEQGVYICYPDSSRLVQIALAVVQSYLPGMKPADVVRFVKALRD